MLKSGKRAAKKSLARVDGYMSQGPRRRLIRSVAFAMAGHYVGRVASAMAFDLFLASIPLMAVAGWATSKFLASNVSQLYSLSALLDLAPGQVHLFVHGQLGRFSGAVAPFALFGSWWLAAGAFHRVMDVLEVALGAQRRPWWQKRTIGLTCVVAFVLLLGASGSALVVISGGPTYVLEQLFGDDPSHGALVSVSALVGGLLVATGLTAGFFRIAVARPGLERRVWPGAFVSVGIGATASSIFAYYLRAFARYAVFYGSLAAVATILIWLWICCAALMLGAELNAQLECPSDPPRTDPPDTTPPDTHPREA